jgi:hypothetical protein
MIPTETPFGSGVNRKILRRSLHRGARDIFHLGHPDEVAQMTQFRRSQYASLTYAEAGKHNLSRASTSGRMNRHDNSNRPESIR